MDPTRRSFGRWASLGLALLGLLLLRLSGTFREERAEVERAVAAERRSLELVARRSAELVLTKGLEEARAKIAAAEEDPLLEDPRYGLRIEGEDVLPRTGRASSTAKTELRGRIGAYQQRGPETDGHDPASERRALVDAIAAALRAHDADRIDRAVRAFLVHRTRVRLAPLEELASAIAVLERLQAEGDPAPAFLRAALVDGLSDRKLGKIPGLMGELLLHRGELSAEDVGTAADALMAIAARAGIDSTAFDRLIHEAPPPARPWPEPKGPGLLRGAQGLELFAAAGNRRIRAPVDAEALDQTLLADLIQRGLLEAGDGLHLSVGDGALIPLDGLDIGVERAAWPGILERARLHFAEKNGLLFLCFFLATGVVLFAAFAERRKLELLEHKAEFVATVSHELRTPLAAVRVLAETLGRRLGADPRAKDYPARIVRESDRLSALVENILSFQRLERGRWEIEPSWVRIADLLPALSEEAERSAKGPAAVTGDGLGGASAWADPELLELALTNLVRNGCRYNQRSPVQIRLGAAEGAELCLTVADNGVGVAEADRASIFEPYVRGKSGSGRGTGLGLALVARVMALHGGRVELVSTGPEGSCFQLRFPRPQGIAVQLGV